MESAVVEALIMAAQINDTTPGDAELMRRVREGDETAFGELMHRWERPVKALIARVVLNAAEADDLAQETFVRAWQHRDKFRPGAEFRPWLFSIALNLARNRLRWWRRRPVVELAGWSESEVAARAGDQRTEGSSGAVELERAERAEAVRDAIAALPLELREAIVFFEYEQMSHAEIAAVAGVTPKAVETRLYRAREKLRTLLQSLR